MEVAITGHGFVAAQVPAPGVGVEPGMPASLSLIAQAGKRASE
jgi:hypothetical protein